MCIEEFKVNVGVYHSSVLSFFVFVLVIDVIVVKIKDGLIVEILHIDNLVFMKEIMDDLNENL